RAADRHLRDGPRVRRQDQAAVPAGAPPPLWIAERQRPIAELRTDVSAVRPERIRVRGIPRPRRVQADGEAVAAEVEAPAELRVLARRIVERADEPRMIRERDA